MQALMMPNIYKNSSRRVLATSADHAGGENWDRFNSDYYLKSCVAGGICCSITHAALCPVDVVKTRIQLDPVTYNKGLIGGMRQVVAAEGLSGLATGLMPTAVGYFVQGWLKFGGVEFFKVQFAKSMGEQSAWDNRNLIYLASSAMAEFIADVCLCPLEAVRIRLVSEPTFAASLPAAATRLVKEQGLLRGLYSGFGPLCFKQIPYTMAKFAVQGIAAEKYAAMLYNKPTSQLKGADKVNIALSSGVTAGVVAAIISHPADTLLSKVNKKGAGGEGSITSRLTNIAREIGFFKLCTVGLGARCVMIGTLTAGQFLLFDMVMDATGAEKFHFHEPGKH
jgi:solute carrier family 25 phosphate transporter 3